MTTADLANLSEITYLNPPTASTPLLDQRGRRPLQRVRSRTRPGSAAARRPYILWNFPQAQTIKVTGGASIEGTIYAPHATLTWAPTQNIEGNVIASTFNHGDPSPGRAAPREIHDFPFNTKLSCGSAPAPQPTATLTLVEEGDQRRQRHGRAVGLDADRRGTDADVRVGRAEVARRPPGAAGPRQLPADRGRARRLRQPGLVLRRRDPGRGRRSPSPTATTSPARSPTTTGPVRDRRTRTSPWSSRVINNDGGSAIARDWVLQAAGAHPPRRAQRE